MKELIALLLCLLSLGGCARDAAPVDSGAGGRDSAPEQSAPAQAPETGALSFEQLALALAELPELPEEPSEDALWKAVGELDRNQLGDEGYGKAYQALWDDFYAREAEYRDAVKAWKAEGVDPARIPALARYTLRTARALLETEREKNAVYSPVNLYLALCMLTETTDGASRSQLLDLLGLEDTAQSRETASALWHTLYQDGAAGKTLLANSLWLNTQLETNEETVQKLADSYFASVFRAPMGSESTDRAIAEWVNANTNGLLSDAAAGLETRPETLMMLLSTLYFKGTWARQFEDYNTVEDIFTDAAGREQKIDFMHASEKGGYYRGDHFTAAALPFRDGTSMWFLLPDRGMAPQDALLQSATPFSAVPFDGDPILETAYGAALVREGYARISWSVPKFDVSSDLDLTAQLEALGVTDIFGGSADFSPLTPLDAAVSAVRHAARVKVDEEGCEAAAFTAVTAETTSAMPEQLPVIEMDLDRPFGFLITGADGLPLFLGVVNTME